MSAKSNKLRHVVIGVGAGVFNMHRAAFELETSSVVAVSDINKTLGRQRAAELGCPYYEDYRAMLADCHPDVTVVMTPHPYHAQIAIDALDRGSHVLVEKPMAVHVAEADAMIAAAQRNQRLLAVNFQHRFRPEIATARRMIAEDELGELQRVEMVEPWLRTNAYYTAGGWRGTWRGEGGGVLLNQAPHGLDLLCHLTGMPRRVFGWTRTLRHAIETEDTALAMLEWPNGALGTVFFSTAEAGPRRMEIVGSRGKLEITQAGVTFSQYATDLREFIASSPGFYDGPPLEPRATIPGTGAGRHVDVYRDFHRAILSGSSPRTDGPQGRMSLELANAIIYASHTNQVVELPLDRDGYVGLLERLKAGK
jgi:predicted dehydrogenase